MSLGIDVDKVAAVLLQDGWHEVAKGDDGLSSFDLDAYEYVHDDRVILSGGKDASIPSTGFIFEEKGTGAIICGPASALQALKV